MKKHLHNSLRALFLSLAVFLSLPMQAGWVEIDGIRYELFEKAKQAAVGAKSSGKYSGEIVIPESVEYKGTVYSVTSIYAHAFEDCRGLTSVTIGNSVEIIGSYAFSGCSGLTSVTIPNSVTYIMEMAFQYCSGLTSVTIGNSVKSIGKYAFEDCSGLTSVTIGNSVTSIGKYAFAYCNGLTSVTISDIAAWCNIDFSGSDSNPLWYAHHLYMNGEEVKDLVIPNSVESIEKYAFRGCSGLTSVTIPNSVTSIGSYAFDLCFGLSSVTIGSGVSSIGVEAFSDCFGLLDVYCYAEKVPSTERDAFKDSFPEDDILHVPAASIDSYKARAPWSGFGMIVGLTPEETGIDELKGENGKENSAVYDLSGRRVQKAQKGIFIQNGKVMVK